MAKQENGVGNQ